MERHGTSQVQGLGMYEGCSTDEKKTRLAGANLFMALLLSIPVKQRKNYQAGEMEIWELVVTSNQTPSKTFRDICVKLHTILLWIVVHLHVKKKMTLPTKKREQRGDRVVMAGVTTWCLVFPTEKLIKCLCPHTLTFEPTVRRGLAAHTSTVFSNRFTTQRSTWGLALEGDPNHGPFIVIRSLLPSRQSQGLC